LFVIAIIVLILAAVALAISFGKFYEEKPDPNSKYGFDKVQVPWRGPNRLARGAAGALAALSVLFILLSSFYPQDAGEAKVQVDWTGNIVGQTNSTGLQAKAPWVDTVTYDIRNQQVVFAGDGSTDNNGGTANGPQITVQDADGVTSNIDVALRYSIKPDSVIKIYRSFRDEGTFKKSFIEQDVRSAVRLVPTTYATLDLLTKRGEIEADILKVLEKRWADDGVIVDSISLQEIRVPDKVRESFAAAQQAQINVETEKANLEAQQVKAQQAVQQAQATADANEILNAHPLSGQAIQQKYIDALKEGTVYVVPEGSTPFIQAGK
jgi:regulator of protease activity HflC (stomatin/prohibitin superfamily)